MCINLIESPNLIQSEKYLEVKFLGLGNISFVKILVINIAVDFYLNDFSSATLNGLGLTQNFLTVTYFAIKVRNVAEDEI